MTRPICEKLNLFGLFVFVYILINSNCNFMYVTHEVIKIYKQFDIECEIGDIRGIVMYSRDNCFHNFKLAFLNFLLSYVP